MTGENWHELIVWNGDGHKGAKCIKKKKKKVTAACVSAGYSTCSASVMISDARADSEHAAGAWQVYLDAC